MKNYAILLLLILTGGACSKEENSNPGPTNNTADFPNEVGYKWLYQFTDLESGTLDTMSIEIVGETIVQNRAVKIWERHYFSGRKDSIYIAFQQDTVRVLPFVGTGEGGEISFVLPLEEGNSWKNGVINWEVKQQKDTTILAGDFNNAFQIETFGGCCNYFLQDMKWFVPQVGIIFWERWEFLFGPIENGRWELIAYEFE